MSTQRRYKWLCNGMRSVYGDVVWRKGVWQTFTGEPELDGQGFHCGKALFPGFLIITFPYFKLYGVPIQGKYAAYITEVEGKGKHEANDHMEVWEMMRVVRVWRFSQQDSSGLALSAAKLRLFPPHSSLPGADEMRSAVEIATAYLQQPTAEGRQAVTEALARVEEGSSSVVALEGFRRAWLTVRWAVRSVLGETDEQAVDYAARAVRCALHRTLRQPEQVQALLEQWLQERLSQLEEL